MTSRKQEPKGLLTVQEAARMLRLSDDTIRRQIREGTLHAIHVRTTPTGRMQYRIPVQVVDDILGNTALQPTQEPPDPLDSLRQIFAELNEADRDDLIAVAIRWARERTSAPTGARSPALTQEELQATFAGSRLRREPPH